MLQAPDQRATYALVEWILGRQDPVEVLEPPSLRQYITGRLQAVALLYGHDSAEVNQRDTSSEATAADVKQLQNLLDETTDIVLDENSDIVPQYCRYGAIDNSNDVVEWIIVRILTELRVDDEALYSFQLHNLIPGLSDRSTQCFDNKSAEDFHTLAKELLEKEQHHGFDDSDPFTRNTATLAEQLSFGPTELAILRISVLLKQNPILSDAVAYFLPHTSEHRVHRLLAVLTNKTINQIQYRLRNDQALR